MLKFKTLIVALLVTITNYKAYAQKPLIHHATLQEIDGLESDLLKAVSSYRKGGAQEQYSFAEFQQMYVRFKHKQISTATFDSYLKAWHQFHLKLQNAYDYVFTLRHAFIVKKALADLNSFLSSLGSRKERHRDQIERIYKAYDNWLPLAESMGGYGYELNRNQRRRHETFYEFIETLLDFYKRFPGYKGDFYKAYETSIYDHERKNTSFIRTVLSPPWYLVHGAGFASTFLLTMLDIVVKNKHGVLFVPMLNKADYMFKTVRKGLGLHLDIEHRDRLPNFAQSTDKEVFLVLPAHQIGFLDSFMLAELKLPSYMIFSHPMAFAPSKFFAKNLANHPQFISVGIKARGDMGSMDQLKYALENKQGNIVVNFPQGHLEPNHIQPINGDFSKNMLLSLIKDGYKVNILPMMWHFPSTFPMSAMKLPKGFPLNSFSGEVLPTIEPRLLSYLIGKEFDENGQVNESYRSLFSILIRAVWIEHKTVYPDLRLRQMLKRMNAMIPGND
ncbi:MAG: hypothetical protein HRU09_09280 [Oligoflexales bacterium]|nr:hypothetical protein [Oligoflexales bacterium]